MPLQLLVFMIEPPEPGFARIADPIEFYQIAFDVLLQAQPGSHPAIEMSGPLAGFFRRPGQRDITFAGVVDVSALDPKRSVIPKAIAQTLPPGP